jgi:hypothetical protein
VIDLFLHVCIAGAAAGTPNYLCKSHQMPDAATCAAAVSTMKIAPLDATKEKDVRVFAYCAPYGFWWEQSVPKK